MRIHGRMERAAAATPLRVAQVLSRQSRLAALLIAASCAGAAGAAAVADGAALFEAKCAACHSVGGGAKLGPDLKGVVARRGKEGAILAMVDPAKAGLPASMPKLGLTQAEAEAISSFMQSREGGDSAAAGKESPAQDAAATPAEILLGQKLFEGSTRFANGGPGCNACHHVQSAAVTAGGILAADLTQSFSRSGRQGLDAMLANAPFPVMQVAYEGKAIKPEEIRALAGFLQRVEKESPAQQPLGHGWRLAIGGGGGVLVLAGLLALIGGRRKKRSVNHDIYGRQIKSE